MGNKKVLAVILTIIMAISLVAGCGSSEKAKQTQGNTSAPAQTKGTDSKDADMGETAVQDTETLEDDDEDDTMAEINMVYMPMGELHHRH